MTRINCVPVEELCYKHLIAEYRELPRVFELVRKHYSSNKSDQFPNNYTMGTGHVKFFYDKLQWLSNRYSALIDRMRQLEYSPRYTNTLSHDYSDIPLRYWNDWSQSEKDIQINRLRIEQRLHSMAANKRK